MSLLFSILIVGIPTYLFFNWVLKKWNIGNKSNRKFIAIIPAICLSPLLYISIIYIWFFTASYYPTTNFNKNEWHTNTTERYKMSQDIIESDLLIGKTQKEVSNLLGDDFYIYNSNHIAYQLGFVPGLFNIDPDVLDIYFENGIVVKVSQHET
ncbi:hypothetical protein [Lacinutrix sp. 5H-3-7-4]|uniref:hypothetical protein n=1 Tax=Lacinutrix sp. (strain 5H-3-7-4) TaxID=983544 RepID=UPI00020A3924|nr:hypothetical protein [Lacinutrix sp. 5H-3-7-4]AEH00030.1 hypothetical protein Lacal_0177 [Lacinutrix sp. 5H-3-7-4]